MIEVGSKSKINLHWKVSPYDYSKEKLNSLTSKVSKKYGLPKDKVKVIPEFVMKSDEGDAISITSDIIQNIYRTDFPYVLWIEKQ